MSAAQNTGDPPSEASLIRSTLRALRQPRRLVPILVLCVPVVALQAIYSPDRFAIPLALAMCLAFVLVAPVSWRVLFPAGLEFRHGAIRLLLYATVGAGVVLIVGAVVPKVLDLDDTLLTSRPSLVACAALFLAGGAALGRDVQLEASLQRARAHGAALRREVDLLRLLALRAHFDPHFLFNTLNAIAEWCRQDGETAERAVLQLSQLLRAVLEALRSPSWTLGEELVLVRGLLMLHLLRDPTLFTLELDADPALRGVPVLPMLLLPLAENAVKHGPSSGHRGAIRVMATAQGERLRVVAENPGPYRGPRPGSSGLPTLQQRLALAYDGAARLSIGMAEGQTARTRVVVEVPLSGPVEGVVA